MPERDIPFALARAKTGWLFQNAFDGTCWEVLSEHGHYVIAVSRHPDEDPALGRMPTASLVMAFTQPFQGEFYKVKEWRER